MENCLTFCNYRYYNGGEICGIYTHSSSGFKKYFHFCFKLNEKDILGLEFLVDENTKKSFAFKISKLKAENVIFTKFFIEGSVTFNDNFHYDNYCFLIDYAYEKYGFSSNEKSYRNLNFVIYYLFYLYCLNSLQLDCRNFFINPYLREKNCAFFKEVLKRIWCTKKQKFIFCFLFFQTYFYFKSFDFNFFF